jgi:hypothetical protein
MAELFHELSHVRDQAIQDIYTLILNTKPKKEFQELEKYNHGNIRTLGLLGTIALKTTKAAALGSGIAIALSLNEVLSVINVPSEVFWSFVCVVWAINLTHMGSMKLYNWSPREKRAHHESLKITYKSIMSKIRFMFQGENVSF